MNFINPGYKTFCLILPAINPIQCIFILAIAFNISRSSIWFLLYLTFFPYFLSMLSLFTIAVLTSYLFWVCLYWFYHFLLFYKSYFQASLCSWWYLIGWQSLWNLHWWVLLYFFKEYRTLFYLTVKLHGTSWSLLRLEVLGCIQVFLALLQRQYSSWNFYSIPYIIMGAFHCGQLKHQLFPVLCEFWEFFSLLLTGSSFPSPM